MCVVKLTDTFSPVVLNAPRRSVPKLLKQPVIDEKKCWCWRKYCLNVVAQVLLFSFFPPFFLSFVHVRAYIHIHTYPTIHMYMRTPVCARVLIHTRLRDPFLLSSFLPTVCVNTYNLSLFSLHYVYARIYIHVFILVSIHVLHSILHH